MKTDTLGYAPHCVVWLITSQLVFLLTLGCNTYDSCDPSKDKPYCEDGVAWNCAMIFSEDYYQWDHITCGEKLSYGARGRHCVLETDPDGTAVEAHCSEDQGQHEACLARDICDGQRSCERSHRIVCVTQQCYTCSDGYRVTKNDDTSCCE